MANIYAWNAFVINVVAFIAYQLISVGGQIPRKLERNCILYYSFDQIQSGEVFNSSCKGRKATIAAHAAKTVEGKCRNGTLLNTQPVTINTESSMQPQNKSRLQLTIAAWIYLKEIKTQEGQSEERKRTIFASYHSNDTNDRFLYFVIWKDKMLRWSASGEEAANRNMFKLADKQYNINVGAWHHVAVSYDFNNGKEKCTFFVNGTGVTGKSGNKTLEKTLDMVSPLGHTPYIGSINGSEPLMGIVDDYYTFNTTLSQKDIQQLMNDTCKNDHSTMTPSGTDHTGTTVSAVSSTSLPTISSTTMVSSNYRSTTASTTTMSSGKSFLQATKNLLDYINDDSNKTDKSETAISKTEELEHRALTLAWNTLNVNQSNSQNISGTLLTIKRPSSGFTFPHKETGKIFTETISFPDDMVKTQDGVFRAFVCIAYFDLHKAMTGESTMLSGFKPNTKVQLNSKIIGAAVRPRLDKPLVNPIKVTFIHAKISSGKQYCSFWNHSIRAWSTSGCHLDEGQSSSTKTVCLCNHLTNFALLLQRDGVPYSDPPLSLKIITIIGCSLSVLACLICFIMFSTLKKKDIRHYLHINLTFAIAVAQLILLFGIEQTEYEVLCKAMAALLHYFYLVAFLLMLCEGVHLAILIETAFSHGDVKLPFYLISSWGLPLIIVGITLGARHDNYGGSTACFISADHGTVYAFVGPFGLILAINLVILIIVLRQVIMKTSLPISSKAATKFEIAKATIRSLVILFPVMGLTWIFGILFFGFRTLALEYLFAIFCSLQGFFIFLFQYALNTENRLAFFRATKRWRLTLTSSTSTSANGTKQTVATKIKITSPSEHDDVGGNVYTSAQDNCNLTAYRHVDDKTVGTMDSRTGSTYI